MSQGSPEESSTGIASQDEDPATHVKSLKARLFISGVEGIPLDVIELTLKQSNNDPSVAFNRLLEVARLYEGEKPTPVGSQGPKFSRVGPGLSSPIQQLSLEDRNGHTTAHGYTLTSISPSQQHSEFSIRRTTSAQSQGVPTMRRHPLSGSSPNVHTNHLHHSGSASSPGIHHYGPNSGSWRDTVHFGASTPRQGFYNAGTGQSPFNSHMVFGTPGNQTVGGSIQTLPTYYAQQQNHYQPAGSWGQPRAIPSPRALYHHHADEIGHEFGRQSAPTSTRSFLVHGSGSPDRIFVGYHQTGAIHRSSSSTSLQSAHRHHSNINTQPLHMNSRSMHTSPSSQDPLGFDDSLRDVLVSLRHILPSQLDYIHEINEKSSTARVWKARLHPPNLNHGPNTGITVAVKRYLIEDETIDGRILRRNWPEVYETFKREFKLLCNANSLHVVRPLGYYVPDAPPRTPLEAPFIVMEWVEGTTLMEFALRLPNDKLELFILRAAQQIASALCQLHQVNVWHQDIHASNIKVWDKDAFRVTMFDLGLDIAKFHNASISPPEIPKPPSGYSFDDAQRQAIDVYQFGVLLYELATKEFCSASPASFKTTYRVVDITRIADESIAKIVRACTLEDYTQRPQFTEVIRQIDEILMSVFLNKYFHTKRLESLSSSLWLRRDRVDADSSASKTYVAPDIVYAVPDQRDKFVLPEWISIGGHSKNLKHISGISKDALTRVEDSADDFLANSPMPCFLIGEPASGKTLLMQRVTRMLSDRIMDRKGKPFTEFFIPIYISLYHAAESMRRSNSFKFDLRSYLQEIDPLTYELVWENAWSMSSNQRFLFLFDGLDETGERGNRIRDSMEHFITQEFLRHPKLKMHRIVVSTRSTIFVDMPEEVQQALLRQFNCVWICPLESTQQEKIASQCLDDLSVLSIFKDTILVNRTSFSEICSSPLLLSLAAIIFGKSYADKELPVGGDGLGNGGIGRVWFLTKAVDYLLYVEGVYSRDDLLGQQEVVVLQTRSLELLRRQQHQFSLDEILPIQSPSAMPLASRLRLETLRNLIESNRIPLFCGVGDGKYRYVHLSFHEFMASRRLVEVLLKELDKFSAKIPTGVVLPSIKSILGVKSAFDSVVKPYLPLREVVSMLGVALPTRPMSLLASWLLTDPDADCTLLVNMLSERSIVRDLQEDEMQNKVYQVLAKRNYGHAFAVDFSYPSYQLRHRILAIYPEMFAMEVSAFLERQLATIRATQRSSWLEQLAVLDSLVAVQQSFRTKRPRFPNHVEALVSLLLKVLGLVKYLPALRIISKKQVSNEVVRSLRSLQPEASVGEVSTYFKLISWCGICSTALIQEFLEPIWLQGWPVHGEAFVIGACRALRRFIKSLPNLPARLMKAVELAAPWKEWRSWNPTLILESSDKEIAQLRLILDLYPLVPKNPTLDDIVVRAFFVQPLCSRAWPIIWQWHSTTPIINRFTTVALTRNVDLAIYIASFFATTLADEDIQEGIQDMEKLLLSLIKDFPHIPAVSSNCFLAAARPTRFDAPSVHAIEEHIWKNQSSESTIKELVQALRKVHSTNFMQKILENPAAPPATIVLAACHYADEMHVVPQEQRSAIISVLMLLKESQVSRSLLAAIHYTLCLLNHFPLHQTLAELEKLVVFDRTAFRYYLNLCLREGTSAMPNRIIEAVHLAVTAKAPNVRAGIIRELMDLRNRFSEMTLRRIIDALRPLREDPNETVQFLTADFILRLDKHDEDAIRIYVKQFASFPGDNPTIEDLPPVIRESEFATETVARYICEDNAWNRKCIAAHLLAILAKGADGVKYAPVLGRLLEALGGRTHELTHTSNVSLAIHSLAYINDPEVLLKLLNADGFASTRWLIIDCIFNVLSSGAITSHADDERLRAEFAHRLTESNVRGTHLTYYRDAIAKKMSEYEL